MRRWLARHPDTPAQVVAVLVAALVVIAAMGDVLGHLITGPLSGWVSRDIDAPARSFSTAHSSAGLVRACRRLGTFGTVEFTGLVAVVAGGWWWVRTRNLRPALCLVSAFAGAAFLTVTVKYAVNRTPASGPLPSFSAGTFPSGHELFAITVYGTLAVLAVRSDGPWPVRWPLAVPLAVLAAGIGLARVYLLDHFLSDVVGSVILGAAWIAVVAAVLGSRPSTRMRN